jgi:hypothetical protein
MARHYLTILGEAAGFALAIVAVYGWLLLGAELLSP